MLCFVYFVDKVYDFGLSVVFIGVLFNVLFDDIYCNGGYVKKYSWVLSCFLEMLWEVWG